jgi:hypothetical protein
MEADLPLSAILLFYLAVFPSLWGISRVIQWVIRRMTAQPTPAQLPARPATQADLSEGVYEIVTTPVA